METIKIDDEVVRVSEMPDALQNMVVLYEEVMEQEVAARKELAIKEAARLEITRRIVAGHREAKAAVAAQAEDGESVDEAKPTE